MHIEVCVPVCVLHLCITFKIESHNILKAKIMYDNFHSIYKSRVLKITYSKDQRGGKQPQNTGLG